MEKIFPIVISHTFSLDESQLGKKLTFEKKIWQQFLSLKYKYLLTNALNFVFKVCEMWHNWNVHHNLGSIEEFELWKNLIATSSKAYFAFQKAWGNGCNGHLGTNTKHVDFWIHT
jgi:hypothetical protein